MLKNALRTVPVAGLVAAAGIAVAPTAQAATTTIVVKAGSSCSVFNHTYAPATAWKQPTLSSNYGWVTKALPVGHEVAGANDIGTPNKTVFLRCNFTLPSGAVVQSATLKAGGDDGFAASVNGTEALRKNMPSGSLYTYTSANAMDSTNGSGQAQVAVSPAAFRAGANVLAAELHQYFTKSWTSPDAYFNAELAVTYATSNATPAPTQSPTPTPAPTTPTAKPSAANGWKLYWSDEFSGGLDTSRWSAYNNSYGDGDPYVLQCLRPANVDVSSGSVKLTAKKQSVTCANGKAKSYTSGFLGSRETGHYYPRYGRYEMRVRVPNGQGLFPGLWLRHRYGAGTAEVDIFEGFHSAAPGAGMQTLHFPSTIGYNVSKKQTKYETATPGRGGWHTFSVDILPVTPGNNNSVRFSFAIDGKKTFDYVNNRAGAFTSALANETWDIALQLWVGGKWVGHPDQRLGWYPARGGSCTLTGKITSQANAASCPKTGIWLTQWNDSAFEIDYVRVYVPS